MKLNNMVVKLLSEFSPMTTEELQRLRVDSEEWFNKPAEPNTWEEKFKKVVDLWYVRAIIAMLYIFLYFFLQRMMNPQNWVQRFMGGNNQNNNSNNSFF